MGLLVFNLSYKTCEIKQGRKDFFQNKALFTLDYI